MWQKSKIWSGKWVVSLLKHEFRVRKGSSLFLLYCFGVGIFLILIMSTRQRAFLLNLVFSVCHAQVNTKIISIQLFTCGVEIANTNHEREIRMKYFQRARCSYESEILSCMWISFFDSFIAVVVKEPRSYTIFRILDGNFLTIHNLQVNWHEYTRGE